MRVPGLKTANRSLRWLRSRVGRHALILGYHRIDDPGGRDPFSLCVRPGHFGEQLAVLRSVANPISLTELAGRRRLDPLPPRAVVVTLDDGYADNLHRAKPLLERHRVPATVFVTSGLLGREAWWDALARIITSSRSLPERVDVAVDGYALGWDRRAAATAGARPGAGRGALARSLYATLRPWPAERRERGLAQLSEILGVSTPETLDRRGLHDDELRELAASELIEIGAHSVSHPELAALPRNEQESEIRGSKDALEALLGEPIRTFSFPNSSGSDETVACVREAGFECACGSAGDVARGDRDPFRLPRFWVPDRNGATFERWLRRWLSG